MAVAIPPAAPPDGGLVVAFYGDDFTGSTDVMETLEDAGIPTLLFLRVPTAEEVAAHPDVRAVGVAGVSRTMSPTEMDAALPPVFRGLAALGAPLLHYKVCSTFDSSPTVGSVGHATELLRAAVPAAGGAIPLVLGVPQLGRWTAFGTLFARAGEEVHRLDRHPTMRVHPMTPMHEADVRRHLAEQTDLPTGLVSLAQLDAAEDEAAEVVTRAILEGEGVVVLDVADAGSQRRVGRGLVRLLERARETGDVVPVVGSSGVEYALNAAWGRGGAAPASPPRSPTRTLAVAGSRAPATEAQVSAALADGFAHIELDPAALTHPDAGPSARADGAARAVAAFEVSDRVLVRVPPPRPGAPAVDGTRLAEALGDVTAQVFATVGVDRLVVAGGDTSGFTATALGIDALRLIRRMAPGAPLCAAVSRDPRVDGLEVCFKAGQIGAPDYLVEVARLGAAELAASGRRSPRSPHPMEGNT